jgi:hypothetical protein
MNPLKLFLIFFLLSVSANAQQRNFSEVDKYAAALPAKYTRKVDTLAHYLTYKYNDDVDKVRSIFAWIADNISYDVYNYYKNNITPELIKTENVLLYKRTVCEGYAGLFKKLCDKSGITCIKVSGYAKTNAYQEGTPLDNLGHSWNIVKINKDFFIVDPTWGSGSVDPGKRTYEKEMNEKYFMAKPELVCRSHYPFNPAFQLLDAPVTLAKFFEDGTTDFEGPFYVNYKDSINAILKLPPNEYELATVRDRNSKDKMELKRIAYLHFDSAQQKCMEAKTPEEKASAIKSMDAAIHYIRQKDLDMKAYIESAEYYKEYCKPKH